jgi:hypothetical protein
MYGGTQNVNPGFQQLAGQTYEDLSSASFYRVEIDDGNRLIINSGKPKIDISDDRIIY